MNKLFTEQVAAKGLLVILSLMVAFHLLVMAGFIPFNMIWGGRLQDASQMLVFEAVSAAINLIMLAIVAIHAGYLQIRINRKVTRAILLGMFVLFLLNTLGNILSTSGTEQLIFTPLTFLLALFSLRLALSKEVEGSY